MGKPIISRMRPNQYLDGSEVYANDATIRGEIEGNVEVSDLTEPVGDYNITVGPVYYGPTAMAGDWETEDRALLVFRVPRDMKIIAFQVYVHAFANIQLTSNDTVAIAVQSSSDSPPVLTDAYDTGISTHWSSYSIGPFVVLNGGEEGTVVGGTTSAVTYKKGDYIRIMCINTLTGGSAENNNRPQAIITATLTVTETHVE